ncbi:hypothetical protein K503DRAFT_85507 [Rhizopogon vinicolor AM-OR11-026]|uniref:Uncharacterized protein n=1 Tax=Rhizopogon vinicolor AM-OR11-026 TaxID=1314800 RepID=A0A1B7N3H7_9AGAM|nr:hypothetical protein K503DRAFT_85507 [Rhizopogon vinicolor AM-OR11-026]
MPEIIHALRSRALKTPDHFYTPSAPHEVLSTQLHTVILSYGAHTSHVRVWLGHGTILPRAGASDFLTLLHHLNASNIKQLVRREYLYVMCYISHVL